VIKTRENGIREHIISASLVRFLIVGLANTCVGLGVIWCAKDLAGVSDAKSNVVGYVVGVTVSFLLNKRWTFSFRGHAGASFLRFLLVFAVSYAANLGTVLGLIDVTGQDSFWCQVCGVVPYSTIFYLGCRWYAFAGACEVTHDASAADGRVSDRS
jgi:putative flippase GtrA